MDTSHGWKGACAAPRLMRAACRSALVCLLLAGAGLWPASAGASGNDAVEVAGHRLVLNGGGTRSAVFGMLDLYSVELYVAEPMSDPQRILEPGVPKAIRVTVRYGGTIPGDLPSHWRDRIAPYLTQEQMQQVKHTFASLGKGDTVWITYAPERGSRLLHDGREVVATGGAGVVSSLLAMWIGPQPVSDSLRAELLARD